MTPGALEAPKGWEGTRLTDFLDTVRQNQFATFQRLGRLWRHLAAIEAVMFKAADNLNNSDPPLLGLFLLRAHGGFLGAFRMAASGQVTEAYPLLRAMLESGLYAFHMAEHPESFETWLHRHDSREATQRVRAEFRASALLAELREGHPKIHRPVAALYERTIDLGAHPNARALVTTLKIESGPEATRIYSHYLIGDGPTLRVCLKTTAQTGICVLDIFGTMFPDRFKILGVPDALRGLRAVV